MKRKLAPGTWILCVCLLGVLSICVVSHDAETANAPKKTIAMANPTKGKALDPKLLESSDGIMQLVREFAPGIHTHVYMYDGDQAFGVFQEPTNKQKILLLISPRNLVKPVTFMVDGVLSKTAFEKIFMEFRPINSSDDNVTGRTQLVSILGWLDIPDVGSITLKIRLQESDKEWEIEASRSGSGHWTCRVTHGLPLTFRSALDRAPADKKR